MSETNIINMIIAYTQLKLPFDAIAHSLRYLPCSRQLRHTQEAVTQMLALLNPTIPPALPPKYQYLAGTWSPPWYFFLSEAERAERRGTLEAEAQEIEQAIVETERVDLEEGWKTQKAVESERAGRADKSRLWREKSDELF